MVQVVDSLIMTTAKEQYVGLLEFVMFMVFIGF